MSFAGLGSGLEKFCCFDVCGVGGAVECSLSDLECRKTSGGRNKSWIARNILGWAERRRGGQEQTRTRGAKPDMEPPCI